MTRIVTKCKRPEFVRCSVCGAEFCRSNKRQRWCSPECSQQGKRRAGGTQRRNADATRWKKPGALEVPAVVVVVKRKRASGQDRGPTPRPSNAEPATPPQPANDDRTPTPPPATERQPAIITIRRKSRFGDVPELAPDEVRRRADLANDMFQEFKRQISEKVRKP
jgi:hypothetical protein